MADISQIKPAIRSTLLAIGRPCSLPEFMSQYNELMCDKVPYAKFGCINVIQFLKKLPDVCRLRITYNGELEVERVANENTSHMDNLTKAVLKRKPERRRNIQFNHYPTGLVRSTFPKHKFDPTRGRSSKSVFQRFVPISHFQPPRRDVPEIVYVASKIVKPEENEKREPVKTIIESKPMPTYPPPILNVEKHKSENNGKTIKPMTLTNPFRTVSFTKSSDKFNIRIEVPNNLATKKAEKKLEIPTSKENSNTKTDKLENKLNENFQNNINLKLIDNIKQSDEKTMEKINYFNSKNGTKENHPELLNIQKETPQNTTDKSGSILKVSKDYTQILTERSETIIKGNEKISSTKSDKKLLQNDEEIVVKMIERLNIKDEEKKNHRIIRDCRYRIPTPLYQVINTKGNYCFEVNVVSIINPWLFKFSYGNFKLSELTKDMASFYSDLDKNELLVKREDIKVGLLVVVFNNIWNRATIKSIDNEKNTVILYCIDYGTSIEVPMEKLRYILQIYASGSRKCLKGRLAGIRPYENNGTWTKKVSFVFMNLVHNRKMFCRILNYCDEDDIYEVVLSEEPTFKSPLNIQMVENRLAESCGVTPLKFGILII